MKRFREISIVLCVVILVSLLPSAAIAKTKKEMKKEDSIVSKVDVTYEEIIEKREEYSKTFLITMIVI